MTLLCEPMRVRLVRRDGSASLDVTGNSEWEFSALRSRINEASVDVTSCAELNNFLLWNDFIEFRLGARLAMRFLLRSYSPAGPGRTRVEGVGLVAQLNRRRHPVSETASGFALAVWRDRLFEVANGLDNTFVAPQIDGSDFGQVVSFPVNAGDLMLDLHDKLAGVYVTYAEHQGGMVSRATGDEMMGPTIRPHWVLFPEPVGVNADSLVNEVLVRYTPDLSASVTWPPAGLADPGSSAGRLQSPPLEFPEILDQENATAKAQEIHEQLSTPQVVLDEMRLNLRTVNWEWLVPGYSQISALAGSVGVLCNLDSVRVEGLGSAVVRADATWDQGQAGAVSNRVAANA